MLQLKIVKGPMGEGKSFVLPPGRIVTIGRAETCEGRLPSAGISKQHCRLTGLSGSKAEVEDLGSSNGTFVNGLLIKKHQLKPGDTIGLNDFILAVSIEAPRPTMAAAVNGLGVLPGVLILLMFRCPPS
jgi:pSer/pThr/pTyr-binding forkhead associated (FHA) protein